MSKSPNNVLDTQQLIDKLVCCEDAINNVDCVLGLLETLLLEQKQRETPIDTYGLCFLLRLTRDQIKTVVTN